MVRKLVWLAALAAAFAYPSMVTAQEGQKISCEPLPGTTGSAFACENIVEGSCACPAGFVAVVETAPAAITEPPVSISRG